MDDVIRIDDPDLEARLRAGQKLRRHPIRGGDVIPDEWVHLYWETWAFDDKNGLQHIGKGFVVETLAGVVRFDEEAHPKAFEEALDTWNTWVDWERWKAIKLAWVVLDV